MRRLQRIRFFFFFACSAILFDNCAASAAEAIPAATDLRVGPLVVDPVGFCDTRPQFSWKLPVAKGVDSQSAYFLRCAGTAEEAASPESAREKIWESGWVNSSQSTFVDYGGPELKSRQRVYWTVQFKDQNGNASPVSEPAFFEMGLLESADWQAEWIFRPRKMEQPKTVEITNAIYSSMPDAENDKLDVTEKLRSKVSEGRINYRVADELTGQDRVEGVQHLDVECVFGGEIRKYRIREGHMFSLPGRDEMPPMPQVRRGFSLDKPIAQARVYVTAKGLFELQMNGQKIGNDELTPGWTDYKKRFHVHTYDVTDFVREGGNALGAILGVGWYPWNTDYVFANKPQPADGQVQELLCQLEVTFTDGSKETITSDGSWKCTDGPIRRATIHDGETYDARAELGAWSEAGYDDSAWQSVETEARDENVALTPLPNQPVRRTQLLETRELAEPEPGVFVFDLGQNMVGYAEITVPRVEGCEVLVRYAEMLNDDGTLYTENLRSARGSDVYICSGTELTAKANVTWHPRFTFHGFRYVELSGLPGNVHPDKSWVKGIVLHNNMEPTGSFTSSDPKLNQLQSNIQWGQRGNFLQVPTDCPQRDERLGWTGDAQVFAATANYNFNTLAFYAKWCADIRDAQLENGMVANFVPRMNSTSTSPGWGDAGVIVPWEAYKSFGYRRILEDNYAMMKRWVEYYRDAPETKDYIYDGFAYGDWLQPYPQAGHGSVADTPKNLIGAAYFARSADIVARVARILGKTEDAAEMEELFKSVSKSFTEKFFDGAGKLTTEYETQTGYLLALAFHLLPDEQRQPAFENLVRLVVEEAGGNLRTGFLGTPLLTPTLTKFGRLDLAYGVLFNNDYPGWFYSIDQGATTMWERWNSYSKKDGFGDAGMNSFNHYAYGAIGEWMYEIIAGLEAAEPGYKRIHFAPHPHEPLNSARAELITPYGKAESGWREEGTKLKLKVVVPPNTSGVVELPNGKQQEVGPGEHELETELGQAATRLSSVR